VVAEVDGPESMSFHFVRCIAFSWCSWVPPNVHLIVKRVEWSEGKERERDIIFIGIPNQRPDDLIKLDAKS